MDFKDKIHLVYDILIEGLELTEDNLMAKGFSREDINKLIEKRILSERKDNTYRLNSIDKFRKYGVELLKSGQIFKANKCFEKCYELTSNIPEVCYQVLLIRISEGNYKGAFEVYIKLDENTKQKNDKNNNLILFLLSYVYEDMPEKYRNRLIDFNEKDLVLPNSPQSAIENKIRRNVFKHQFTFALKNLTRLLEKKDNEYSSKYQLISKLLKVVIANPKNLNYVLLELVEVKEYQSIVDTLEEKAQDSPLSYKEQCILLVAKEIVRLSSNRVILEPTSTSKKISKKGKWFNMEEMLRAIKENNFELALRECARYMEESKSKEENMVLYYLLKDWKELSSKVKNEACILTENDVLVPLYELDYNKEDEDILDAYSIVRDGLKNNISLEDIIGGICFLNNEPKLLVKLVYARYCYYNAMRCYDLAWDCFSVGDDSYLIDYYKAVKLFYEYVACGDKLISEVKKSFSISPKVEALMVDVENYKKSIQVSSETKRLVKE